ncbi:hypothetical protein DFH06DRAFT_1148854, partial [Mycena polygramma]
MAKTTTTAQVTRDGQTALVHLAEATVTYDGARWAFLKGKKWYIDKEMLEKQPALVATAVLAILPTALLPNWLEGGIECQFEKDETKARYTAPVLTMTQYSKNLKQGFIIVARATPPYVNPEAVANVGVDEWTVSDPKSRVDKAATIRCNSLLYAKFENDLWWVDASLPATTELYGSLVAAILATKLFGSDTEEHRIIALTVEADKRTEEAERDEAMAIALAEAKSRQTYQDQAVAKQHEDWFQVLSNNHSRQAEIVGAQEARRERIQASPKEIPSQLKAGQSISLPTMGGGSGTRGISRNARVSGSSQRRRTGPNGGTKVERDISFGSKHYTAVFPVTLSWRPALIMSAYWKAKEIERAQSEIAPGGNWARVKARPRTGQRGESLEKMLRTRSVGMKRAVGTFAHAMDVADEPTYYQASQAVLGASSSEADTKNNIAEYYLAGSGAYKEVALTPLPRAAHCAGGRGGTTDTGSAGSGKSTEEEEEEEEYINCGGPYKERTAAVPTYIKPE